MGYPKLVRDKIPEIIAKDGKKVLKHNADNSEYSLRLREKLNEEVTEFLQNPSVEEMADILEVIEAIQDFHDIDPEKVEEVRRGKATERGRFEERFVIDWVGENKEE